MGYNLTIGELTVNITDDGLESIVHLDAEVEHEHKNPVLYNNEPTDGTNNRWPSYSSWSNFCRYVGLHEFFYDNCEGLMREHSGCFPLKEEHREIINKTYNEFMKEHPDAVPSYKEGDEANSALVRLEWLKYWINWALDNCKQPVFANS